MSGPLHGLRVVELAGLGAAPFCGMVLADLGAAVVRVDRIGVRPAISASFDVLGRGKQSMAVDLKRAEGREVVLRLADASEALIEGFRPGVTERLGVGPDVCLARNPALVYGRLTGWGQDGLLADTAGHDINYIAISGALGSIGPAEDPVVPLNLVGDFGGGGMLLALGVVSAVLAARDTGVGQVVDAAMVDGSALLLASHHGYMGEGWWSPNRASNLLDGAAPFYTTYRTADGGHVAVGALEPKFFAVMLEGLGLSPSDLPEQYDRSGWHELRGILAERFASGSRDHWVQVFSGTDACVSPVLSIAEATQHQHLRARDVFIEIEGVHQPAPAPRFSVTRSDDPAGPARIGADTDQILESLGYSPPEIGKLRSAEIVV